MKSSFYFKHDLDAREDDKMRQLIMKHGATGYGIYWMLIEDLYRNKGRLNRDYPALSWAYHQPQPKVKAVVEDFDAFYDSKGKIACRRVDRGIAELKKVREQAALNGRRGGVKRALSGRLAAVKQGEERKGEERKERETAGPSLFEIREHIKATGSAVDPERYYNVNSATGWMVRGSAITDWKSHLASWEKHEKKDSPKLAEEAKKKQCQNKAGCGLVGNWIAGQGADGTPLCSACLEEEAVLAERA